MSEDLGVVHVPLTQGKYATIDAEDAAIVLAQGKWFAVKRGKTYYAARSVHRRRGKGPFCLQLHTFLTGYPITDHRDGDGLNNRRTNLRDATKADNQRNQGLRTDNSSGYKGVSLDRSRGRWLAKIHVAGRTKHIGRFLSPEDAARAYDKAASFHFGEFAWLNFPKEDIRHGATI